MTRNYIGTPIFLPFIYPLGKEVHLEVNRDLDKLDFAN